MRVLPMARPVRLVRILPRVVLRNLRMLIDDPGVEPPCEVDGKPCEWQSEEWHDEKGELESWDLFCAKCGRWRKWELDEMPEPKE